MTTTFRLRKRLLEQAKELDDQLVDKIRRSPTIVEFLYEELIPFLEFARNEAIRVEYDSMLNGNPFTARAEGFSMLITKLEKLHRKAFPPQKKRET